MDIQAARERLRRVVLGALLLAYIFLLPNSASATRSVTLAWDPSPDSTVAGYNIYFGASSRSYTNIVSVGNTTNAIVAGLIDGGTYFFSATAYDATGLESDFSNEVGYVVPTNSVPTNSAPVISTIPNQTVNLNNPTPTIAFTIGDANNPVGSLTLSAASSNPILIPPANIVFSGSGSNRTVQVIPASGQSGNATITVTVSDGSAAANSAFSVIVLPNQPPTLDPLSNLTINEDAGPQVVNLSGISSGSANENQALTITVGSSNPGLIPIPGVNYTSPNSTGALTFAPAANASGTATITVTVNDGQTQNNLITRTFTVTVNPINDPPTLNTIGNLTINENAGTQTVNLSGISSGAANENQTLTVTATSSNPSLIPNPTVVYTYPNGTGTLALAPTLNNFGSAVVTVTVNDGQPSNSIVTRSFTVTVNAVNQPPTLNPLSNVGINENAGQQTVNLSGISSGAANENQALTVTATSSDSSLIPNPAVNYTNPNSTGTLTFAPALNAFGTATITVTVNDGQPSNNIVTRTFSVAVGPVNQWPTLDALNNVTLNEDSGLQTINLSGITSGAANENQTLTVTASSSNPSLIPSPVVNYSSPNTTGSLTLVPAPNANGTATITVTVNDGQAQNNITTRAFTVVVSPVNDPPTLNPISNLSINENAGQQTVTLSGIGSGAANESDSLTVTAISSNPGVVPNPTVNYASPHNTGTMTFAPVVNAFGSATITVTVNDGQSSNNVVVRTFIVTVAQVNKPPTLDPLIDFTINENASLQTINLSGISSGAINENQILRVSAVSSNPGLIPNPTVIYTSPNTTGTLNFAPLAGAAGTAIITVTVNDGQSENNIVTRVFSVTVNAIPTISAVPDQTIVTNTSAGPVSFVVSDLETPASNLVVWVTSSSPALIPTNNIVLGGNGNNRTIKLSPLAGKSGSATITLSVSDGRATGSTNFQLFVISPTQPAPGPQIQVNGSGSVSPNVSGQSLMSGQIYTLTATPALGYEFAGWSGSWNSSLTRISFLATSNLLLRANFVPSPYIPVSGSYSGLFYQDDQVRLGASGSFTLVVTTRGTYSGQLQLGSTRYSFAGKLNLQCQGTNYLIASLNGRLSIDFQLNSQTQPYEMIGRVTDGKWTATLVGGRAAFNAATSPAPFAGTYTVVIPGQTEDPIRPAGHGYGSLRVDTSGRIRFSGVLSDGTKVTQSSFVTRNASWPLYASLYSGGGCVISWLSFVDRPNDHLNGALSWIKPPSSLAPAYRAGFTYECEAVGSKLTVVPGARILNLTDANVQFLGGGIVPSFSNAVTLGLDNKIANASTNSLTMTFSPTTGIFKGKVLDPFTSQQFIFGGVAFQKMNAAYGFLLNAGQSSQVNFEQ